MFLGFPFLRSAGLGKNPLEFCCPDKEKMLDYSSVDRNIIEASWKALVEAIEYKLLKG